MSCDSPTCDADDHRSIRAAGKRPRARAPTSVGGAASPARCSAAQWRSTTIDHMWHCPSQHAEVWVEHGGWSARREVVAGGVRRLLPIEIKCARLDVIVGGRIRICSGLRPRRGNLTAGIGAWHCGGAVCIVESGDDSRCHEGGRRGNRESKDRHRWPGQHWARLGYMHPLARVKAPAELDVEGTTAARAALRPTSLPRRILPAALAAAPRKRASGARAARRAARGGAPGAAHVRLVGYVPAQHQIYDAAEREHAAQRQDRAMQAAQVGVAEREAERAGRARWRWRSRRQYAACRLRGAHGAQERQRQHPSHTEATSPSRAASRQRSRAVRAVAD